MGLSVAYKNVVGAKRASWRTLSGGFDDADEELLNKYKAIVEDELESICQEVLNLLTKHLCKNVEGNGDETEVFYLKMCGDYYRYLSEFREKQQFKDSAEEFYKKAMTTRNNSKHREHKHFIFRVLFFLWGIFSFFFCDFLRNFQFN